MTTVFAVHDPSSGLLQGDALLPQLEMKMKTPQNASCHIIANGRKMTCKVERRETYLQRTSVETQEPVRNASSSRQSRHIRRRRARHKHTSLVKILHVLPCSSSSLRSRECGFKDQDNDKWQARAWEFSTEQDGQHLLGVRRGFFAKTPTND